MGMNCLESLGFIAVTRNNTINTWVRPEFSRGLYEHDSIPCKPYDISDTILYDASSRLCKMEGHFFDVIYM